MSLFKDCWLAGSWTFVVSSGLVLSGTVWYGLVPAGRPQTQGRYHRPGPFTSALLGKELP